MTACRAQGGPLDPARVKQLGLVLSRFEYNGAPNDAYREGPFELQIAEIGAYQVHARDPTVSCFLPAAPMG